MKHILNRLTVVLLSLSLVACSTTPKVPPSSSDSSISEPVSSSQTQLRPAQQSIFNDYEQVLERYNIAVDAFNADSNLSAMDDLVEIGNAVTDAFDEITPMMDTVATFTDEDIKIVRNWIVDATEYIDMLEGLVASYGGKESLMPMPVALTNETGVDIQKLFMAPQSDDSWGNNLLDTAFKSGETVITSMIITEDCKVWDLQATDNSGIELEFYGLDFSNVNNQEPIAVTFGVAKDGSYTLIMTSGAAKATPKTSYSAPAPVPVTPKPSSSAPVVTPSSSAPVVTSSATSSKSSSSTASSNANKKIIEAELEEVPDVTYEIGAAFRASDIKFLCRYSDGSTTRIATDKLTITANGVSISNGYKFKQSGTKKIVIKYKDWEVDYKLEVVSNLSDKKVDRCELQKDAKTLTYKVGGGFRADEIVIRCYYTDGTHEDFDHQNIEFYVNSTQLKNGYKFKEAGKKTVKMKFMDYSGTFNITVTK